MTKEDKQLLLVDLLARLPYGIKIKLGDYDYQVCGYNSEKEMPVKIWYYYDSNLILKSYIDVYLTDYRPYLRLMSSMTEEEVKEFYDVECMDAKVGYIKPTWNWHFTINGIDWLNAHHFDYRGLIEKGLALEVTKENNPYEN